MSDTNDTTQPRLRPARVGEWLTTRDRRELKDRPNWTKDRRNPQPKKKS